MLGGRSAFKWKREVEAAAMTSKSIIFAWVGGGNGAHVRPRFAINPATGALEAIAEFRLEARKALIREVRRIKLRLYLDYLYLRFGKLAPQGRGAIVGLACDLAGHLPDPCHVRHRDLLRPLSYELFPSGSPRLRRRGLGGKTERRLYVLPFFIGPKMDRPLETVPGAPRRRRRSCDPGAAVPGEPCERSAIDEP
jgi:hypothetical protein